MKVIKVGFIISRINGGGREKRAINLALDLSSLSNFDIFLVSNDISLLDNIAYFESLGLRVFYVQKWGSIKFFKFIFSQGRCILHTWGFIETFYSLIFKIFNYKIVNSAITGHSSGFKFSFIKNRFWSFILNQTDFTLSNSQTCLESFFIKNKYKIIFNSCNPSLLDMRKDSIAYKFGFNLNKRHIVMIANFKQGKLFKKAIDLLNVIEKKLPDVVFVFIGKNIVLNFNQYCDKRDNLILFDHLERNEILEIQNFSDVGLLISKFEGQCNSILEFMSMSKPVVVVEGGGMDNILINNFNSIYHKEFDLDLISADIINILKDTTLSKFIANNGFRTIIDFCDNKNIVNNYIEIYRSL